MLIVYCDAEYRGIAEPSLDVVCFAYLVRENGENTNQQVTWVYKDTKKKEELFNYFAELASRGAIFAAYNVCADASAMMSLHPSRRNEVVNFKWIDLMVEVRQARNWCSKHMFGKYVSKRGEKKFSYPPIVDERGKPIWLDRKDPRKKNNSRTGIDLSSSLYHYLDVEPDLAHKNATRDLILRGNYTDEDKEQIIQYAASDVVHLPNLFKALQGEIRKLSRETFDAYMKHALIRGEWSARLALMERIGIPVDRLKLERIAASRGEILNEWISLLCEKHFPFYEKDKKGNWVFKDERKQEFVISNNLDKEWPKSKISGKFSFTSEVLDEYADIYPAIKELVRIRQFDAQSKSYNAPVDSFERISFEDDEEPPAEGRESIFQRIGTDGRLRTWFSPYSTQTSRNAPPARSFILAQAKWIRSCLRPPEGWCFSGIDFGQQEFLLAASMSKDENMLKAYDQASASGEVDVYINVGILAGMLPKNATKKTHPAERRLLKVVTLGKQFSLGVQKLHRKCIAETGDKNFPLEKAEELDRMHKEVFSTYWDWNRENIQNYQDGQPLRTQDGWWLFTDNPNSLSCGNFPIQGAGAVVLRRAVKYGQEAGIQIVAPLHDAVYFLHREEDEEAVPTMRKCMNRAFRDFFGRDIRMDSKTWRHNDIFLEDGAMDTFALLAKYFMSPEEYSDFPLCTNIIS